MESSALPHNGDLETLLDLVKSRCSDEAVVLVRGAYEMAANAHAGQQRVGGRPYITHPLAVAIILARMGLDPATLAAALLHDVIEDTPVEQDELHRRFGNEVARLVDGATKIRAIESKEKAALAARRGNRGKEASEAENLRRMLLASVNDLRVILIKMADRLHNMRTLRPLAAKRRRRLARETLEIYAPLANRLGIWQFKSEFEDRALRELQPEVYARIQSELADRRARHDVYLATVIQQLGSALGEGGIKARISGRAKHFYSIYRKMLRKDLGTDEIYDVLAVRVVVPRINDCYVALGIVHAMWPPMPEGFDDYIAKQKNNLYQSLHTTVYGPENRLLEIQIRTEDMHEVAEHGVAAHWVYKEDTPRAREIEEKITALRRLIKSHGEEATDADAFVEGLKTDVFRDQVYVFTPLGDVKELPAGSTPVDFAYQIHTEVGHRCRGALVNGRMVALDYTLRTGDSVKIITAKGSAAPSRDWLNPALGFVASSRARAKIKQWYRRQRKQDAIREGRDVLERQLRKLGLTRLSLEDAAALFDFDGLDEFMAAVGRHDVPPDAIADRLLAADEDSSTATAPESA
ncbi:MAG: RelA/SpoT family protein, partial [Anaerolineae bacterium]